MLGGNLHFVRGSTWSFSLVALSGRAEEPLYTKAENSEAHYCFYRQDNPVILVDEYPAIDPEQNEMDDEDQPKGDYQSRSKYISERHNCVTAVPVGRKPGPNWIIT